MLEQEFNALAAEGYNRIPVTLETFADLDTPLSIYLKNGMVKVALAVAKGKKDYDKRDSLLERASKRDIDRELKERNR